MQKYRSFMLRRVSNQTEQEDLPIEQAAQQSLFEISKKDEDVPHFDTFLRQLNKLSLDKKRYQKISVSLPKKKPIEEQPHEPIVAIPTHMRSLSTHQPISITNYLLFDRPRKASALSARVERKELHEQANRKAKYLFRCRNKEKSEKGVQLPFGGSFYTRKLQQQ